MKQIISLPIVQVFLLGFLLVISNSCNTEVDPKLLPVLTTTAVTNITQNTAASGGNISSDAGSEITARGVVWSLTPNPTIKDSLTEDGTGTGTFERTIKNLLVNTNYYVKAYATNKYGTAYGLQEIFKTLATALPIITTMSATDVTVYTATIESNITSNGGSTVTASGVCWSTTTNPTIADNKMSNGIGIGAFSSSLTELTLGTKYYVRSYATNSIGTAYSSQVSFTTQNGTIILTSSPTTSTTTTTSTSGGNITSDGGAEITERGVCWSTRQNPTINDKKTSNGNGTGAFVSNLTELIFGTSYYVRSYAINNFGIFYGNQINFTQTITIGMSYFGGKIAYIDASGIHGFVCALVDQSRSAPWWNGSGRTTNAYFESIESTGVYGISKSGGRKNTDAIILKQGAGTYAAAICAALTTGGATAGEWYLPTKGELNQLFVNRYVLGGFSDFYYWSSTSTPYYPLSGVYSTWYQSFYSGDQKNILDLSNISDSYSVRAIRSF